MWSPELNNKTQLQKTEWCNTIWVFLWNNTLSLLLFWNISSPSVHPWVRTQSKMTAWGTTWGFTSWTRATSTRPGSTSPGSSPCRFWRSSWSPRRYVHGTRGQPDHRGRRPLSSLEVEGKKSHFPSLSRRIIIHTDTSLPHPSALQADNPPQIFVCFPPFLVYFFSCC